MGNALKWILLTILAVVTGPIILFVWFLAAVGSIEFDYDVSHPDYERFASEFRRIRTLETTVANDPERSIDFSVLASGRWQKVCLLGGDTNPLGIAERSGWQTLEVDRDRLDSPRLFRRAVIEEFEVMIAYVNDSNEVEFIHFKEGIGPMGQNMVACIEKPTTRLELAPIRRQ